MRPSDSLFVKRRILSAAAVAIGLATAGSAAAECKVTRIAEWPVRTTYDLPVVDGAINGQKIGILLDTGMEGNLIQRSATTRLGLTRRGAGRIFGVGGESHVEITQIDELRIGQLSRRNLSVLVAGEHDFGDEFAFILGNVYFQQVDLEFDLAHNAVRVYETKDCEDVSLAYWATEPAGEVPIDAGSKIQLTVAINGKPVRTQLDSGSSASMLSKPDAARLGVTPESPGTVAGGCVIGLGERRVYSWIGLFESFAIGNEIIRNPRIPFADLWQHTTYTKTGSRLPNRLAGLPDMVLGVDFLRAHRVLISRSQRKMYFTYAGGTVFPGTSWGGCNALSPSDPRPGPLPKQGEG